MEEEGRNTSEAWGLPISNVDTFSNLTDSQFLVRVLGPKHMGYEVSCIYCLLAPEFLSPVLAKFSQNYAWHLDYVGHVCNAYYA